MILTTINRTMCGVLSFALLTSCSSVSLVEQAPETKREVAASVESIYYQNLDESCYLRGPAVNSGPLGCFAAGTLVNTPTGLVKIESLKIGHEVYSYNTSSKRIEISKVIGTSSHAARLTCKLKMRKGPDLTVTPNHEFYFPAVGQWHAISSRRHLLSERLLRMDDKRPERTTEDDVIETISRDIPRDVYNIEVSANHNYFVSGILVHNKRD